MAVLVRIPTPLRSLTKGQAEVQVAADTVAGLIEDLEKQYPGLKERLVDEGGEVLASKSFTLTAAGSSAGESATGSEAAAGE